MNEKSDTESRALVNYAISSRYDESNNMDVVGGE